MQFTKVSNSKEFLYIPLHINSWSLHNEGKLN